MTRIESPKVPLQASPDAVRTDLADFSTIGALLQEGPVSDFQHDGTRCQFKVTGGVAIHLAKAPHSADDAEAIRLVTEAPTPVKFSLSIWVVSAGEGSECQVICDAELNPFTKMMVEPALNGLFASMTTALQGRYA